MYDGGGLILSKISAEVFNVFSFALKSLQFVSDIFSLLCSDIVEEPELNFLFVEL